MDQLTPTHLLAALRESGLLSVDQLAQLDTIPAETLADHVKLAEQLYASGHLTAYQSRKLRHNRVVELIYGPYLILDKIGEGGMGKVFKAVQLNLGRFVALKVVRPHLTADKRIMSRWRKEAKAAAKLQHPNIVRLIDADEAMGRHFMAMEFVDGSDLSRLVKSVGPLHYAEAAEYIRQAALGLQHAHDSNLVHRDIKPSNLLVAGERSLPGTDGKATVKILDMGLVRSLSDEDDASRTELTRDGTVVGTPDYMAPEQARNSSTVDGRADLYSLGCTLFYLLNGQPPYPEGSPIDKLLRHRMDPPPNLRTLRPDIPVGLVEIVETMMAKEPGQRYWSAADVATALAKFTPDKIQAPILDAEIVDTPVAEPKRHVVVPDGQTVVTTPTPLRRAKPLRAPRVPMPDLESDPAIAKGAIGLPRAPVAGSSESIPTQSAQTDATHADSDELPTPLSKKKTATRKAVKKKAPLNWVPLLAALGGVTVLVIAAVLLSGGGQPNPEPEKVDDKKQVSAPAPVQPPRIQLPPAWANLPDTTTAYLIAYPEAYWAIEKSHPIKERFTSALGRLNRHYRMLPQEADRITFAMADDSYVGVAEGSFASAEWERELVGWIGVKTNEVNGQKLLTYAASKTIRGAVLPGRGLALANDESVLATLMKRGRKRPQMAKELFVPLADPIDPNKPTFTFVASGRWKLPNGKTLSEFGIELIVVNAKLVEEQFEVSVSLTGHTKDEIVTFLNRRMYDTIKAHLPGLVPFATAASDNGSSQEFIPDGNRLQMRIAGIWPIADVQEWIERLLPPPGE